MKPRVGIEPRMGVLGEAMGGCRVWVRVEACDDSMGEGMNVVDLNR